MLFNSHAFIFLFLPTILLGFYFLGARAHHKLAISWLVAASLFFYGWWNPVYLSLIIGSIIANYALGLALSDGRMRALLWVGVAANLCLLGYFKYTNFMLGSVDVAFGTTWQVPPIVLPLAISFFTFQQIAYLVDAYQGKAREISFLRYCLFVTFFPQLIAGPIVHHKEMLPQFARSSLYSLKGTNLSVGLTIFAIGLFKKVVIADGVAEYATPVFDAAASGDVGLVEAWGAAFAYTFQLYFDFSGYSDMAIGLARLFGIKLPVNFFSPYKAASLIDFWRRWHMTLSRFLKDYLYIPLGGRNRRLINVMITMGLAGLWHGAGWTFVAWGILHGVYLVINHVWRTAFGVASTPGAVWAGRVLTFFAVVIAWVLFRAEDWDIATTMLSAMAGMNGLTSGDAAIDINWASAYGVLAGLLGVVWLAPNTYQLMSRYHPTLKVAKPVEPYVLPRLNWKWRPSRAWAITMAFVAAGALSMLTRVQEFLYYQF